MPSFLRCSGTTLKRFACLCMLIDHIGASVLQATLGVPYLPIWQIFQISQLSADHKMQTLILLNCLCRSIGRLAFPLFAFFLVEGFLHTKNVAHYLLRLVCFGLISEPFFDLAFFGTIYYPGHQNIYATLSLALLALYLLRAIQTSTRLSNETTQTALFIVATLGICSILYVAEWLHTDYAATGVLLILSLYLSRSHKAMQSACIVLIMLDQFPAPFAAIPHALYNGARGKCAKWEQWAFYAFYPAHLALFTLFRYVL